MISRLFMLVITLPVIAIAAGKHGFPFAPNLVSREVLLHNNPLDWLGYLFAWWRWDNVFYVMIAAHGYSRVSLTVFFPIWPLVIWVPGRLLAFIVPGEIPYYLAGILLSNLFFLGSLQLLYVLTKQMFDAAIAKTAIWLLAFFPYTIFFSAGYTESLFLFFCLAACYLLQRGLKRDWWLASLCGGIAAATRETGAVIAIVFVVAFMQRYWPFSQRFRTNPWRFLNALCSLILLPLGVLLYMYYLYQTRGNPLLFLHAAIAWDRSPAIPFSALFLAFKDLLFFAVPLDSLYNNLLDLAFTLLPLYLLIKYWRCLPLAYSLFSLALLLYSLSTVVSTPNPLMSIPRYLMVIFPCIMLFALEWKHKRRIHKFIYVCFPLSLAANVTLFVIGRWVA
ncbi:membrane protein [Dictyobacter kobayashii]|uniref:Membrane protein n=1 Tax=Dictyobacter kobayashii TaxID=2014872 RepID=A0A402AGW8_9CHLR|nr:membrane protein [Dictyobacter kobayashii]